MAIQFARTDIISAGTDSTDSSALGLSAYIAREDRRAEATERAYGFAHRDNDLEHLKVYLPKNAPVWMKDGQQLWNAIEAKELTRDRKTKELRFKTNAQLAKHTVLALPKELSLDEQRDLLERFIVENYTSKGVAVEAAIHRPHEGGDNWHAHLLVTTREISKDGIGKKARHLNPDFNRGKTSGDSIGQKWADFQNAYFIEKGLDINVDPTAAVPFVHVGNARFVEGNDTEKDNEERLARHVRLIIEKPYIVTSKLTEKKPFFTERDVSRYLFKAGFDGDDFDRTKAAVMAHAIPLYQRETGAETGKYTTQDVRNQEREILREAKILAARNRHRVAPQTILKLAISQKFSEEQQRAFISAVDNGRDLSVWRGVAGTGKSYVMNIAKNAYEQEGYNVIGLAPTNAVVRDMEKDGFAHARTVHSLLYGLENGTVKLDKSTVLFVDEAAMLDNERLLPLLKYANQSNAKVILIGDDRQLASIERGSMFTLIRKQHNASELRQVRRQTEDWSKQASIDFADKRFEKAVGAYDEHGRINWAQDTQGAKKDLVEAWKRDTEEKTVKARFVYAQTNKDVNELNAALRQVSLDRGSLGPSHVFQTKRGEIEISERDRIQFYDNDKYAGIYNGHVGVVTEIKGDQVAVHLDNGNHVQFDAKAFQGFGLGYAGTVYRGQGKTQLETYYLHTPHSDSRTSYVAMTRHRDNVSLFVGKATTPNVKSLARQMSRENDRGPSLRYATKDELERTREAHLKQEKPMQNEGKMTPNRIRQKTVSALKKVLTKGQEKKAGTHKSLDLSKAKMPSTSAGKQLMEDMNQQRSERRKSPVNKSKSHELER